jgi:hypothetical protein
MSTVALSFLFKRLVAIGKPFWLSSMKYKAFGLLASVLVMLMAVSAVNVYTSAVAGRFARGRFRFSVLNNLFVNHSSRRNRYHGYF